jgi:Secretion system C-terminal sorting domain/Immunoglobulin I-set domain
MRKLYLMLVAVLCFATGGFSQVTITATAGVTGPTAYTTLNGATGAFAAINAGTHQGAITITISGNTTEPAITSLLPGTTLPGNWTSILMNTSGAGPYTVSGTNAGTSVIDLLGADNVTIDGGGVLTISNTSNSATTGTSTIRFVADAVSNTVTNCTVLGSGAMATGTNGGNIYFATGSVTGNDNNTISNCKIAPAGANLPTKGIYGNGSTTTTAINNSGISITNCEIYDYFGAAVSSAGMYIAGGNNTWSITNNKLYQTATRTATAGVTHAGIYITNTASADGFTVTGNTIGYASNTGTGTYTVAGAFSNIFYGVYLSGLATGTTNNISSNIISDISFITTSTGTTGGSYSFAGINLANGATTVSINTNTIRNISLPGTGTGAYAGIDVNSVGTGVHTLNGNTINNIARTTGGTTYGIRFSSPTTINITNNTISNIAINNTTATSTMYGIGGISSSVNSTISGNTVNNITTTSTAAATIYGIREFGISGNKVFQNNIIYNLTAGGGTASIIGLSTAATSSPNPMDISGNTIYTLSGGSTISAIAQSSSSTTINIIRNKIYDLSAFGASGSSTGLNLTSGTTYNIVNNYVGDLKAPASTGLEAIKGISATATSTYNVYYNTVYLNATSSSTTTFGTSGISFSSTATAFNNRNNIIVNLSTPAQEGLNVATNGVSAALRRSGGTAATVPANYATTSNNNNYWANPGAGTNNHLTYVEGLATITNPQNTVANMASFMVTRDAASKQENPPFLSTVGASATFLHINTAIATAVESGASGTGITGTYDNDYDADIRQGSVGYVGTGTAPDIGADEFGGIPLPVCAGTPAASTIVGAASVCSGLGTTLTLSTAYTDIGITHHWGSSTVSGGPYTGLGILSSQSTGALTVTTYFVDTIFCTSSGLFFVTPEKTVTVNALPIVAVSPTTGSLCQPGATPITLTASGASTYAWSPAAGLSAVTGTSVTANPTVNTTYTVTGTDLNGCINTATSVISVFAKPSAITVTPASPVICAGATQLLTATGGTNTGLSSTIGSGTAFTGATGEQTAFCNRRLNYVGQTIYTAAELTAAGISAGNITSLSYNISSNGDATTNAAFTVKIGHEGSLVNFPSTAFLSNVAYTTVYGPATYTHASPGWQVITFTTPFVWDGVSNICIDVRHNGIDALNNAQTQFTTTAGNASIFGFNTPAAGTLSTTRLNIQLGFAAPANAFTWAPLTDLYTDAPATIAYTGTSTNTVYAKLTATQTYTVTSTNPAGCTSSAPVTVTVSSGAAITAQPVSAVKCAGQNAFFKVVATGPTLTYQWYKDGSPLSNGGTIGGATTDSLYINGVIIGDAGVYTVQVSSSCGSPVISLNTITLTVNPVPTASAASNSPVCSGTGNTLSFTGTTDIGVTYSWTGPGGFTSSSQNPSIAAPGITASGVYTFTATAAGCTSLSSNTSVVINPTPAGVAATASTAAICAGNTVNLFSVPGTPPATILSEGFEAGAPGWSFIDSLTTGTAIATQIFHIENAPYTDATGSATFSSFSITGTKFAYSNSDAGGSGSQTRTFMASPTFSTIGYTGTGTLTFKQGYRYWSSSSPVEQVKVQITIDGGATWTDLVNYSGNTTAAVVGVTTNNAQTAVPVTLTIPAGFMGQPTVQLRWRYLSNFGYYWVLDDISLTGTPTSYTYSWTSSPAGFTSAIQNPTLVSPAATTIYTVGVSGSGCTANANVTVTVTPPTSPNGLAGTPTAGATTQWTETHVVATGQNYVEAATCDLINKVLPAGASPVSGSIFSAVRVDTGATKMGSGELYAARFYAIEPATAPATSTARITLYYLQSEFDNYNLKATDSAKYALPTGPADALGISRLVIRQFHGTPTGGYLPGNYAGANEVLDPADADVIWNATASRWEITVPVSSFSGFWLTSVDFVVPVRFTDLYAKATGNTNTVYWTTSQENNNRKFVVERSADGRSFTTIGEVATQALNGNSSTPISYSFVDGLPFEGKSYYKLRQVDRNGAELATPVVTVLRGKGKFEIVDVRPNPTTGAINFNVIGSNTAITVVVRTLSGQQVMRSSLSQSNSFSLNLGGLSNGMYLLEAIDRNGEKATFKIVKQ